MVARTSARQTGPSATRQWAASRTVATSFAVISIGLVLTGCKPSPPPVPPPSPTSSPTASGGGLPPGDYVCRDDGGLFKSDLTLGAGGTYTGGSLSGTTGTYTYDPGTGTVEFLSGVFFTAGPTLPHHYVGRYPSNAAGDSPTTLLLASMVGYPGDADGGPALVGSGSGFWHCSFGGEALPSPTPSSPTPTPQLSPQTGSIVVPYGEYENSEITQGLQLSSDGTYAIGPTQDPESGQTGTYHVIDSTRIGFDSGPYIGQIGYLTLNYHGIAGRDFIDVTYNGTRTTWQFYR